MDWLVAGSLEGFVELEHHLVQDGLVAVADRAEDGTGVGADHRLDAPDWCIPPDIGGGNILFESAGEELGGLDLPVEACLLNHRAGVDTVIERDAEAVPDAAAFATVGQGFDVMGHGGRLSVCRCTHLAPVVASEAGSGAAAEARLTVDAVLDLIEEVLEPEEGVDGVEGVEYLTERVEGGTLATVEVMDDICERVALGTQQVTVNVFDDHGVAGVSEH